MSHIKELLYHIQRHLDDIQEEQATHAYYNHEAMMEAMAEDAAQDEFARRERSRTDLPVATVHWL